MKKTTFFIAFFSIYFVLVNGFYIAQNHLTGQTRYKGEIAHYKKKIKEERFHHSLATHEFNYFKQQLAHWIPANFSTKELKNKSHYPLRSMASLVQAPNQKFNSKHQSIQLYKEAKTAFRIANYEDSIRLFSFLIEEFPSSPHVIDSLFLLMESQFQLSRYEASLKTAKDMIQLFPEHELSGFTMVRMGQIFEVHERTEEAIELYKLVLRVFPQREVANQARASLRASRL